MERGAWEQPSPACAHGAQQRSMEVLPGDLVSPGERSVDSVGPGVSWEDAEGARAHVAGFLKTDGRKIWVDFSRKRVLRNWFIFSDLPP